MSDDSEKKFDEKELEKAKIDVLRDAVKDASDTLRAVDRKVFFLTTKTLSIIPIFAAIMLYLKLPDLEGYLLPKEFFTFLLIVLGTLPYFFVLKNLLKAASPKLGPVDNLESADDKIYGNNFFFVHTLAKESSPIQFNLDKITNDFDEKINNAASLKKLLIKENIKVSYIRDTKIFNFNKALNHFEKAVIISSIIIIATFIIKMIYS